MINNTERFQKGFAVMKRQLGAEKAENYIKEIEAISDVFAQVNVEFPFGDLYSRSVLDTKTREIATIAALTVQGFALPQLKVHIAGALQCGVTRAEVLEIITQMLAYCGFPAATNALYVAKEIFDELDEKAKLK
jgi:4-carboxymuconolactone decarboxylase